MLDNFSKTFQENLILPEKRDKVTGLYLVRNKKDTKVVFKCKTLEKLGEWCFDVENTILQTLKNKEVLNGEKSQVELSED